MIGYNLMTLLKKHVHVYALAVFAYGSTVTPACALPGTENLSLGGTATSSQSDYGTTEANAIDGNRDGNFGNGSLWYGNPNAENNNLFYQVDLGVDAYIDRVQILRRTDANQGVFGNMRLTIYEDDGAGNPGNITFTKDYLPSFQTGTFGTTDPGAQGAFGRHVRLERIDPNYWLTFAEFEVIGSTSPLKFTENNNIARGKPVTTLSAPGYGALISSGNDGDINADFYAQNHPVYHSTNSGVGEYWQVDLGREFNLDYLELFARSDARSTSEYLVSILDENLTVVGTTVVNNPAFDSPTPGYDHTIDVAGLVGRYIRIETTQEEFLMFSELRAFAVPEPTGLLLLALGALGWVSRRNTLWS
jgi:hypothetical protein